MGGHASSHTRKSNKTTTTTSEIEKNTTLIHDDLQSKEKNSHRSNQNSKERLICIICNRTFENERNFSVHWRTHSKKNSPAKNKITEVIEIDDSESDGEATGQSLPKPEHRPATVTDRQHEIRETGEGNGSARSKSRSSISDNFSMLRRTKSADGESGLMQKSNQQHNANELAVDNIGRNLRRSQSDFELCNKATAQKVRKIRDENNFEQNQATQIQRYTTTDERQQKQHQPAQPSEHLKLFTSHAKLVQHGRQNPAFKTLNQQMFQPLILQSKEEKSQQVQIIFLIYPA